MATLAGGLAYTGSLGSLSAYRMQGVDRIVIRTKGGASREKIRNHPDFERTRENNQEWKACTMATRMVREAILPIRQLADYNYAGPLTAVCKSIQKDESTSENGKRAVLFSQSRHKLEGFGLNKYTSFDSILSHPLQYEIDRPGGTATIQVPEIIPGINLQNPRKQAMFRFIFTLARLSDIVFREDRKEFMPVTNFHPNSFKVEYTPWYTYEGGCKAQAVSLSLNNWQEQPDMSLLFAAGVDFGQPVSATEVKTTKYAGAAKVLKLV